VKSLFENTPSVPLDPIMRLFEAYNSDPSPSKLNLVVGVYTNEQGDIPILRAVQAAERAWISQAKPKSYRPIEGTAAYRRGVQELLFGADSSLISGGHVATLQSLGGTGALKIGADLLHVLAPQSIVAVSSPSWENHRSLFETAGFDVVDYAYYNAATQDVDIRAMLQSLEKLAAGTIVVLHACCHNPTGNDLSPEQWESVIEVLKRRQLIPFMDIAYQGFGDGLDQDALAVRLLAKAGMDFLVASSFSKSFSLYGERVGALTIVSQDAGRTRQVEAFAKRIVRTAYSNPPTHGAVIVESVLCTPALRAEWETELGEMRNRIRSMRQRLVSELARRIPRRSFEAISRQKGMFSYSGLSSAEAKRLRDEHKIFMLETGRICVAALNENNLERVVDAIGLVSA